MTDEELTEYRNLTNAQIAAFRAAIIALIHAHPDRPAVAAELLRVGEHLTAQWLNSRLPDLFVSEFQKEMAGFQKRAQSS